MENALYFLPLLELGRFLKEKGAAWLDKNQWISANFLMAFLLFSYINGTVNVSISQYGRSMLLYLPVAALGSLLAMEAAKLTENYAKITTKALAFIGRHTLAILCWHLFAIEIIKTVLRVAGIAV